MFPEARSVAKTGYLALRRLALSLAIRPNRTTPPSQVRTILIVSQPRLGDAVLELPVLGAFRERHPQVRMGIVAPLPLHGLFAWASEPAALFETPDNRNERDALVRRLSTESWDAAVDLATDYPLAPARIAAGSSDWVVGFEIGGRGRYFSCALRVPASTPMPDVFAALFENSGLTGPGFADQVARWSPPLPTLGVVREVPGTGPLIGLHPGGRHPTQRWGAERFARLAGRLSELGSRPVVLGGGPDAGDVDRIRRLAPVEVPHLETDADAKSLARALAGLDLLVCNNSGPLHLASLIGVPTVSTMGPTRPELWWPAGHRARVLRRDELDCIGCNSGRCRMPSHLCMDLITVDDVLGAVSESLGLS